MSSERVLQLRQGEEILGIIKRSLISELLRLLFAFLWILVPFFFFFPLLRLGFLGLLLFALLVGSGGVYLFKLWMMLSYTMLIVTNQRIIDVVNYGLFDRQIQEVDIKSVITAKVLKRSFIKKILNIGTVRIKTKKSAKFDLEIEGVKRPHLARQFVEDMKNLHN